MLAKRMMGWYGVTLAAGMALILPAAAAASTATMARMARGSARTARGRADAGPKVKCTTSNDAYDKIADRLAQDIDHRLTGRISSVGLELADTRTDIVCLYHAATHFYAASAIKVTILAALLRKAQEQHRSLTASEKNLAWLMITQSSNAAASSLWSDVGVPGIQHFLNLAKMSQTELSGAWGLSLLTAHDETLLLKVLSTENKVLTAASRRYERYLMAHVVAGQRWGVPAGAPATVTVHVKNGWLGFPSNADWEVNSLGIFMSKAGHRVYTIAMLTHDNPDESYGIETIENAAEVMHRVLNYGKLAS